MLFIFFLTAYTLANMLRIAVISPSAEVVLVYGINLLGLGSETLGASISPDSFGCVRGIGGHDTITPT